MGGLMHERLGINRRLNPWQQERYEEEGCHSEIRSRDYRFRLFAIWSMSSLVFTIFELIS